MVHQGGGVIKNSQEQGRQEIPERMDSGSTGNSEGGGDRKPKD